MYIYLDESGDLGFDFENKKPSKFFIITLLVCESRESLHRVRTEVKRTLNRKLNYRAKRIKNELKGNNTELSIKGHFYKNLIKRDDFKIHTVILDKQKLLLALGSINPHRIYVRMSYDALKSINIPKDLAFIHIAADRCKRGNEANDLASTLRSHLETLLPLNAKITIEQIPSTNEPALQAVDIFSYGIFRKYESKDLDWYNVFENKISVEILS